MRSIKATLHHGQTYRVTVTPLSMGDTILPRDVVRALDSTDYGSTLTEWDPAATRMADDLNNGREAGRGWVWLEMVED